jgi:PilZ domain-containing protein
MYGTIENLSSTGALVDVRGIPSDANHELELKLGGERGWVSARTVRVERTARRVRIAVTFDHVDERLRAAIDTAIEHAIRAAERMPTLIVDERIARRTDLIAKLAARGMTPLAPKTPLDAIDLLTRAQLHVSVCLLAPGFGQTTAELRTLVAESFPWVTLAEISDDLDATADRALDAWSGTDVARFSSAIA